MDGNCVLPQGCTSENHSSILTAHAVNGQSQSKLSSNKLLIGIHDSCSAFYFLTNSFITPSLCHSPLPYNDKLLSLALYWYFGKFIHDPLCSSTFTIQSHKYTNCPVQALLFPTPANNYPSYVKFITGNIRIYLSELYRTTLHTAGIRMSISSTVQPHSRHS